MADLWQPIETAPLNPYGKYSGPTVLIFSVAENKPWPCYFLPYYGGWTDGDTGPAWVVDDGVGDQAYRLEDVTHWMPPPSPPELKGE